MLTLLLATVETTAHSAEAAGPIEGLRQTFVHFGVEPKYLVMQVISFLILFGVLYKFGIKPTIATMEERNNKIAAGLKHAEETQARLAAAQQESAALIRAAQVEANKAIEEARKAAKEFGDKQQADAIARAADLLAKAQQSIELEHKKMLDQARTEIARLVVKTTEQVLAKKLSDADRAAYNEAATKELSVL
ncbi:ATP synthase subunit b, sodium ion specific [Lacunisphaera limnophila]|uniref:ATP synthase subunit b n=1 Tax=Lacunisphaera limnophila TaxID=1838286 RepID=A0A1D8ASW0_9BACT|nr:F0F1 ATP synthase subunit B [Lacunisphaera limnophila]AOS43984.1 ATP synthase subunit b, sodium ion specific [Lacunisphaera limnophila]